MGLFGSGFGDGYIMVALIRCKKLFKSFAGTHSTCAATVEARPLR